MMLGILQVTAQTGANPFEIVPRLERDSMAMLELQAAQRNPFEMMAPRVPEHIQVQRSRTLWWQQGVADEPSFLRMMFVLTIILLSLLALLLTVFGSVLSKAYRSFFNSNMLTQVYREQGYRIALPYVVWYLHFVLQAGLLLYLTTFHFNIPLTGNSWQDWLLCTLVILSALLIKHLVLYILGAVSRGKKDPRLYSFTILIFYLVAGLALAPVNILVAYLPSGAAQWVISLIWFMMALLLLYRALRGLLLANKYVAFYKFHFLLYLCAIEVAPVLVGVKVISQITG